MSTAVHGARVVGGMQKPHDKGEEVVGYMVSTTTKKVGGNKRGKDKAGTRIRAESTLGPSACSRVSCMVLGVRVLSHLSNNTPVQLTRTN
jgi:hypothetical protein